MVALAKRLLPVLVATGTAAGEGGCNCEAVCARTLEDQRRQIASLQAELNLLRGSFSPVAAAARRTSLPEQAAACGDFTIRSDVDRGVLRGCHTVQALTITGSVTSLEGLEELVAATSVTITSSDFLVSLGGLEALASVEGALTISSNPSLSSLLGLQGLRSAGSVTIEDNAELRSVWGLHGLQSAVDVTVKDNAKLRSLSGLLGLTQTLELMDIENNRKLKSLEGLQNITGLTKLYVWGNEKLKSLEGLENLSSVTEVIEIRDNPKLASFWPGLQRLWTVGNLGISGNQLENLAGLENLTRVPGILEVRNSDQLTSFWPGLQSLQTAGSLVISRNDELENLRGLEKLEVLMGPEGSEIWSNDRLSSLSGLEGLQSAFELRISYNDKLDSLQLHSLTNASLLSVSYNPSLSSLSGLQNLRSVGQLSIWRNNLASLHGLENLESAQSEFDLRGEWALSSLDGLEGLTRVGTLRLDGLRNLKSVAGLRSLTSASGSVIINWCHVASLTGMGALRTVGRFDMLHPNGGERMEFLGGPFAAGASIGMVNIHEAFWPSCITPHERSALVSAVGDMDFSSIPDATWLRWQELCERRYFEPLVCTRGQPCNLSLAGEESVFISGRFTGCGDCSEKQLHWNVTQDGMLDLGYALKDEEAGPRSICRCGRGGGPVAQLLLRGPRQNGLTVCNRGHPCALTIHGELQRADRVVLMSNCSTGNPLWGFAASWTAENMYLLHDAAWSAAPPAVYELCWRAPCSSSEDAPTCPAPEDGYFRIGEVELHGPYPRNYTLVLGDHLSVANIGLGVTDGDRMRLRRTCGESNEEGADVLDTNSSGRLFDFGMLTEDRVEGGRHHLCWCHNSMGCNAEWHFLADSGQVQILCPIGQELVSSNRCRKCPAGKHRLEPGLEPCSECSAGQFSPGGESCEACPDGTYTQLAGSSACVSCHAWESTDGEAAFCTADPQKMVLLASCPLSVGALCALLVRSIWRRLSVADVSLDQGHTIVTTVGSHGLSNFGRSSSPATLCKTGHPGLDCPETPLRVRVKDAVRLELVTHEGGPILSRLDTSMGTLKLDFPYDLYHQHWLLVPLFVGVPALLATVVALGALAADAGMRTEALLGAAAAALACTAASAAVRFWPRATPLERRVAEFKLKVEKRFRGSACAKGPTRALAIGKLHELLQCFRDLIRDRTAYYLVGNIICPLTKARMLSYAEFVGAGQVEWFVSHCWGTGFQHFCTALQKHAETVCGERCWTELRYWVCFCSNNQHHIQEELGADWQESSFYVTLKSGLCQGTCMVLDDRAMPLTRIWCIFELLQTVKLKRNSENFQGLLLCTSSGVLNTGNGSVDVAMALAEKVAGMDLEEARATSAKDADMIRQQVIEEMGSFAALNQFTCREVCEMLAIAQRNSNHKFAEVLAHLEGHVGQRNLEQI